jgi:ABC-type transporter Mla MlaB component
MREVQAVVVVDVDGLRADIALIDALARVQLDARRRGRVVRLRGSSDELRGLLRLVGLADLLVEVDGEPEEGEQLGIDEAGDLDDLPG